MRKLLSFLLLPREISDFERGYLARMNRVGLGFFLLHVPALTALAFFNGTGPLRAFLLTLAVVAGPLLSARFVVNPRHRSLVLGVAAMFMGGVLVHVGQGPVQIEMHFYFFALIAMLSVFGNPMVIVVAAVTVALHHLALWFLLPASVFNYEAPIWVVLVHAAFVVLESVAACFIARSFFDNVIGLERIVRSRTAELDVRNRHMRLVLDNVGQGFLTLDPEARVSRERSAAVDAWFGPLPEGATLFDLLAAQSPVAASMARVAWGELREAVLPLEVNLAQLPASVEVAGRHVRIDYQPIGVADPPERLLVVLTDETAERARARAERDRGEALQLFERLLNDRAGFLDFFEEATNLVDSIAERASEPSTFKRMVHTLKGNAAIYGLASVSETCHAIEDTLGERAIVEGDVQPLVERWRAIAAEVERLLGGRRNVLEIGETEQQRLEDAVRAQKPTDHVLRLVQNLRLEPTRRRLENFAEQAQRIAARLEKQVSVVVHDHGVRLDGRAWAPFWGAFLHAVRNAVDHGIESPDDRLEVGKEPAGTVALHTSVLAGELVVEIVDDGRGIDWGRLTEQATALGLPTGQASLENLLFQDGVTTAREVTDLSGRGVGMGALREATRELGGSIAVESRTGQGTVVRMRFPLARLAPTIRDNVTYSVPPAAA